MKHTLVISERNKTIEFKNRLIRTPVNIEVTDKELSQLIPYLKMLNIEQYYTKSNKKTENDQEVKIETLNIDYNTPILERLTGTELT